MEKQFVVGQRYTRTDIFAVLKFDPFPVGGNWFTGYHRHAGAFYIFSNIGTAGRTGHDYGDHWQGHDLYWRGKTGSTTAQPQIQELVSGTCTVHIFTRTRDREPFVYAGVATAKEVRSTVPVTVIWTFEPESA